MSGNDIPQWALGATNDVLETVRKKDLVTYNHCLRVGVNAGLLAQAAGLDEYTQKVAEFSGLFHDVGKVGIPDVILNKPSQLETSEFEVMKSHPQISSEMIAHLTENKFFRDLLPGVLYHHERIDGRGYPNKKSDEEIPLTARIIAVVDTVDAITMDRPYRKGLPLEKAISELRRCAGTQFDFQLVRIYLDAHSKWGDQYHKATAELRGTVLKAA